MLFAIQSAHTLIYIAAVFCIGWIWVFVLTGHGRNGLPACIAFPLLIGIGLLLNGGECFFQTFARAASGDESAGWTRDLLLIPEAIAVHTPLIFTPPFVLGSVLALIRVFRENAR